MINSPNPDDFKCLICMGAQSDKNVIDRMCLGDHTFCVECINNFIQDTLISEKDINMKCAKLNCGETLFENKLEAILKDEIKFSLTKQNLIKNFILPKNLLLISCPLCPKDKDPAMFLINKNDHIQFYSCTKENCNKKCCLICYQECLDERHHEQCVILKNVLIDVEKVYEYIYSGECRNAKKTIKK